MIFPVLKLESTLQIDDKTRLDATGSYVTNDEAAITSIEIEPHTGLGFIDVTIDKFLDYQYDTAGEKTVSISITTDGLPTVKTKKINVITEASDSLFSTDEMLLPYESNILDWVRDGRITFKDVHREAQVRIVAWLDEHRIWDREGNKLTKAAIVDVSEVRDWSKYWVLKTIFENMSNATDDVFAQKALKYSKLLEEARNRSAIRLDLNGDGVLETAPQELRSMTLVRR